MADTVLIAHPFLGGYERDFSGTKLCELCNVSLLSIAQPLNGQKVLGSAVKSAWGCTLPLPGKSLVSKDKTVRLLCFGADSYFAISDVPFSPNTIKSLAKSAYLTDQSEVWVTLRLSGPLALRALERICPVDLHQSAMPEGAFARTVMEHLGTIILREGADQFLLLSASSSAASFLHALEVSIENVG